MSTTSRPPTSRLGRLGRLGRWLGSAAATPPCTPPPGNPGKDSSPGVHSPFETLFRHAVEGWLACGEDGIVTACNPSAAALFGRPAARLVGRHLGELLRVGQGSCTGPRDIGRADAKLLAKGEVERPVAAQAHECAAAGRNGWLVQLRHALPGAEERVNWLANYDTLTGLPNRALFRDRLAQAMARARRSGRPMALMFIDLDHFKIVNDSLGHEAGDRLLQHVTRLLTECLRDVDSVVRGVDDQTMTLSRLGGDEFTVIAESVGTAGDAAAVARRVLDALATPFHEGGEEVVVSASIGISMFPTDDVDLDLLVRHTDMAMYRSKSLGRGIYSFFSDDLNAAVSARLSLEGSLRRAVEREEFELHFQPKADLVTGRVTGVEALIRWHQPGQGMVPPDRFIGVLEDTGLILPVGAWVIRTACRQLADWDRQGLPPLRMAVNLSARQFRHLYLASLVQDSLRENAIEPARLEIELTESLLMEDNDATRSLLESFTRMGVRLAIDDFGTGHSSLTYLRRFHVDVLKIDRSFVQAVPDRLEDTAISSAVIALGRSMGLTVVAEGVETREQAEALRDLGCHEMQGWLLGRAMPAEALVTWLRERRALQRERDAAFGAAGISSRLQLQLADGEP